MGGSGEFDFFQQLFQQAPGLLIMPLVLGGIYVVLMTFIFRRAAQRRAKAKAALALSQGVTPAEAASVAPVASAASIAPAPKPSRLSKLTPAQPAAKMALPEPDLDLLTVLLGDEKPKDAPATLEPGLSDAGIAPAVVAPVVAPVIAAVAPAALPPAERVIRPVEAATSAEGGPDGPADAVEVLRVWRDLSDGGLIVGVGGRFYSAGAEIDNPDVVRRVNAVIREMSALIGSGPAPVVGTASTTPAAPGVAWGTPSVPNVPGVIRTEAAKPTGRRRNQPEEPQTTGIANAVEEFLQFKLMSNPQFATRSLHIRPAIDGGVLIEVDGHYYQAIGDVVDADVREFLAGMMKEWEARH